MAIEHCRYVKIMIIKPFNSVFWLMYAIGLSYFLAMWYWGRNKSQKERKNTLLASAILLIAVFAVYKYFLLTDPEYYQATVDAGVSLPDVWQELPLNGCNICMILLPIALLSNSDSLMSVCAIIGVFLPIFPTVVPAVGFDGYSIFTPRIMGFYITHIFVLYNGCLLYAYGFFRPKELFDFLYDIYGTYTEYSDIQYFVPNNYVEKRLEPHHTPSYRLICCQNSANQTLLDMLATSSIQEVRNYELLSYGDALNTETARYKECPTVILLDREQVVRSQSLTQFLYIMSQQNSKNCFVLFRSKIEANRWNCNTAANTPYCGQFYPRLSSLKQRVESNLSHIPNVIQQYLSSWKKEPFLIGISYAHFDDHEEKSSDIKKLKTLVDLLVEEYGEHRILFDKLPSASNLFPIKGKERSLSAYKECKLCLLLWNFWSTNADNCIQEREAMNPYIENGTIKVMYLHCGTSNDRPVPNEDYPHSLNNLQDILADIHRILD